MKFHQLNLIAILNCKTFFYFISAVSIGNRHGKREIYSFKYICKILKNIYISFIFEINWFFTQKIFSRKFFAY